MGIWKRISNLFRSNVNAAIDRVADPEKEIEQLIRDMEEELLEERKGLRDQLAQAKILERKVKDSEDRLRKMQDHARMAVQQGNDALARDILRRLQEAEGPHHQLAGHYQNQMGLVEQETAKLRANEQKFYQIKARKESIKAQARMQKKQINTPGETAFDRFDQLVEQIEMNEHQAAAWAEVQSLQPQTQYVLSTTTDATGNPALPGAISTQDMEIEQRLRALKESTGRS